MNIRWVTIAGAGVVAFPWMGRTLAASVPPEAYATLPMGAQVALLAVAVAIIAGLALSALVSFMVMIFGGEI